MSLKRPSGSFSARAARPLVEPLEGRTLASASPHASVSHAAVAHAKAKPNATVAAPASVAMPLTSVKDFSYVLGNLNSAGAVTTLAQSKYDMLVVDPTATFKGNANFDMAGMVAQLHAADPGRIVLAYLNIGEAADFRTYWQNNWKAPTKSHHGNPAYILESDPSGWSGSYPTAFWNAAWQKLFIGKNGIVQTLMKAGFDGVSLGWVSGYNNPTVAAAARRAGVNPARSMVQFVSKIRKIVKTADPGGDVLGIGGSGLATADPAYLNVIDGGIFEDTWFYGTPNAAWDDPTGGDLPVTASTTSSLIDSYKVFQSEGKPVFTIDYALQPADANLAYIESSELGFVPLVTQVSVALTTTTPPPWLT
jgi:cysteinyl-tRNA synthetase